VIGLADPQGRRRGWHERRFEPDARKVEVVCAECTRLMWLPASKVSMYRRCSPECSQAAKRAQVEGRTRACETCGETFTPRRIQVTKGGGRFCSQACNTAHLSLNSEAGKIRSRAGFLAARAAGRIRYKSGPEHRDWTGGLAASKHRRIASGKSAAGIRAYRTKHPERAREWADGRRGLPRLPRGTVPRIGNAQGWRCAICAVDVRRSFHVDHIMPLKLGGRHEGRNLQLLCRTCNVRKNAKDPIDYMRSMGRLL
jgi:5-methylcytosine-specific restriction endonuclease McrA